MLENEPINYTKLNPIHFVYLLSLNLFWHNVDIPS